MQSVCDVVVVVLVVGALFEDVDYGVLDVS